MRINQVRRELLAGNVQVGTWLHSLGAPQLPQILATAGFDYVNVDMEHSSFSLETVGELCRSALLAGIPPFVRPAGSSRDLVTRPLDNGAMGVYLSHIDTPEAAARAVDAVKFPPLGTRGSQPPNVHTDFDAVDAADYMPHSNRESMVVVQIESAVAVGNLDGILAVPGVDGAVVGRGDLAADLGLGGDRRHPDVTAAVEAMIAACERHGRFPGLMVTEIAEARTWIAKGIRMITYASEVGLLRTVGRAALHEIRAPH